MRDHRLLFEKTGLGVYISHLDLMRTMQRAFLRAGLRVKHTEGFNPRPHMVFALPLPVGCGSTCELVDFRLESDHRSEELCELLTPCLPDGVRPVLAYQPGRKFKEIKWLKLSGILHYPDGACAAETVEAVAGVLNREQILVRRKTKRGEDDFDLAPFMKIRSIVPCQEGMRMEVLLSAQEPTVNPALIVSALRTYVQEAAPAYAEFTRKELYDAEEHVFR